VVIRRGACGLRGITSRRLTHKLSAVVRWAAQRGGIGDGRANPGHLKLAERLIMALVDRLPADSAIEVG
jgi:hypothetical protein